MNCIVQLIALTLELLLFFFVIRGVIHIEIGNIVNKRERKRLAKNQSFKEWFFYKRYVDVLPKSTLVWYFSNFVSYIICMIAVIILNLLNKTDIGRTVIWIYFSVYGVSLIFARLKYMGDK